MSVELVKCSGCGSEVTIYNVDASGLCYPCQEDSQPQRFVCTACHGSALSPYPDDGGGCPHCYNGYTEGRSNY